MNNIQRHLTYIPATGVREIVPLQPLMRKLPPLYGMQAGELQIRDSAGELLYQGTLADGVLVLDPESERLLVELPAAVTAGWDFTEAYYTAVLIHDNGQVYPCLTGRVFRRESSYQSETVTVEEPAEEPPPAGETLLSASGSGTALPALGATTLIV